MFVFALWQTPGNQISPRTKDFDVFAAWEAEGGVRGRQQEAEAHHVVREWFFLNQLDLQRRRRGRQCAEQECETVVAVVDDDTLNTTRFDRTPER